VTQGARPPRVLVVDDEDGVRSGLRRFLALSGFEVSEARDCAEAVEAASRTAPEAALVDYNLPDGSGVELLARLKVAAPDLPVIVLTGHGSIELAVQAIKEGAEQFLTKPADPHAVVVLLKRVIESSRDQRQRVARQSRRGEDGPDPFLGPSAAVRDLRAAAEAARGADSTVLIRGETGVGKGVLARWLHRMGARSAEPFVDLNCASLSRELVETELFGHEAGAFTGAVKTKVGLFEVAHRGTVFLDEIGDLELALQPKLLTVLEERRFRRVGEVPRNRTWSGAWPSRRSAATSTTASARWCCASPRCATAPRTSLRSPPRCSRTSAATSAARGSTWRLAPCRRSRRTPGQATCASCATRSSARCSRSSGDVRSRPTTCGSLRRWCRCPSRPIGSR
jgi:ActR/RegA family two-component response regulator